jgi:hypothetical protein
MLPSEEGILDFISYGNVWFNLGIYIETGEFMQCDTNDYDKREL